MAALSLMVQVLSLMVQVLSLMVQVLSLMVQVLRRRGDLAAAVMATGPPVSQSPSRRTTRTT